MHLSVDLSECHALFSPKALNASHLGKYFDPWFLLSTFLGVIVQDTELLSF